jgi:hypothetical protein
VKVEKFGGMKLDIPQKLRKLRVEALIFTGGMNKNYIG